MSLDLLCVGHAAYDLNLYLPEFPRENSKAEIQEMSESGGGPAANAAYLGSFWGLDCAFAGLVGADAYGERIREDFAAVGTRTSLLELRPGHSTPFSVILVNTRTGSRTIVNRKAPAASFRLPATMDPGMTPKCLMFDGHECEASLEALERWPEAVSILDAGSVREGTLALAGRVQHLIASERFALQVTGEPSLADTAAHRRMAHRLKERFTARLVVTLGERGLIAEDGETFRHLPAFPAQTVDTTAAGDIFHGAFAYGCVIGMEYWANLRHASMSASLSVQVRGGRKSIPRRSDVETALIHAH